MKDTITLSAKGKRKQVSAIRVGDLSIIQKGKLVKKAKIFDEYWIERDRLKDPYAVIDNLRQKRGGKPDIFTFSQRVPESEPKHKFRYEFENVAVLPITTFENWFKSQITSAVRRNIRASRKKGIEVRAVEFDDDYIRGIMAIYNESPVRHGKKYWHYGKDFETVKRENGTYAERSIYLVAFYESNMIGYLKIVLDKDVGAIMQILSQMKYWGLRPNNALLSEAVKQCCEIGVRYICYEKFVYGKKGEDSLTKFKKSNGFERMDLPQYYVPLTAKGSLAMHLGLHKSIKEKTPEWAVAPLRKLRNRWFARKNNR